MILNPDELATWIGRTETRFDVAAASPLRALAATLDRDQRDAAPGSPIPLLSHWLYFLDTAKQSELGPDGHARRGAFLPPVPLPHRMWAGGALEFHRPIRRGEPITRVSTVNGVTVKQGRSGQLVFVTVEHRISGPAGLAITEQHDIVYRGSGPVTANTSEKAPAHRDWEKEIRPDEVLLFRYSALTFNGHRIHYDRRYAVETEGYPGLVVHGPLVATLLMDLVTSAQSSRSVRRFRYRARMPLFDNASFRVCGATQTASSVRLWAENESGGLAMDAVCEFYLG